MKKMFLILSVLILIASCDERKNDKKNNTEIQRHYLDDQDTTIINGIKCYILQRRDVWSRVVTTKRINPDSLKVVAENLKLYSQNIKFYLPEDVDNNDWAAFIGNSLFIFDEDRMIENVDRLIIEQPKKRKEDAPIAVDNNIITSSSKCQITAQNFVKNNLKNPRSADFYGGIVHEVLGSNKVKVIGKFSATNSFGGEIENHYRIIMKFNGGEWTDDFNWEVISLEFE